MGQLKETGGTSAAPLAINSFTFPRQYRPKDLSFPNVTFTSPRSRTVRTLDRRTSWAPRRNNTKASAPSFKEPPLPSTPFYWEWVAPPTTITRWSHSKAWVAFLKDKKLASKLHMHFETCPYQWCPLQYHYQLSSGANFRLSLQPSGSNWPFFGLCGGGVLSGMGHTDFWVVPYGIIRYEYAIRVNTKTYLCYFGGYPG